MSTRSVAYWGLFMVLMVPAGVVTAIRLTDPVTEIGIQVQAFTPYAAVPYALALVLLSWGVVRRPRRHVAMLVPMGLAAVGLVLHLTWFSPVLVGEERTPADGADEVMVMTSNLYFGRGDAAAVVRVAAQRGVDVLVLTEVTVDSMRAMRDAGLANVLPHHVGTAGAPGSNDATMVFSREPVVEVADLDGTTFDNLIIQTDGFTLLAAHPAAPLEPLAWRGDHARILAAVAQYQPDLLAGDLNATLDHRPVRNLEGAGLRDVAELSNSGFQPTWPANGKFPVLGLLPPSAPIDHVMVSEAWAVLETGRVDVPDSDHLAVVATVARAG